MTEIVDFSFYPDSESPVWGCLHVLTDAYGGRFDRHATLRGDPELVRGLKLAFHDRGGVLDDGRPRGIGGTWQMTPGWPGDWGDDPFRDEAAWTPPFEIGPDGTIVRQT